MCKYFLNLKRAVRLKWFYPHILKKISDLKSVNREKRRMRYTTLPSDYGAVLLHLHDGSVKQHLYVTQTPAHSTENRVNYRTFSIIVSIVEIILGTVTSAVGP
jgi:hypothetical protein